MTRGSNVAFNTYARKNNGTIPAPTEDMSKRRIVDYRSESRPSSVAKQLELLEWLAILDEGTTLSELASLVGMSRQLCLYHVKKLAAERSLIMVLEPCESNSGLQFRIWDESQLAARFARRAPALRRAA